MWISDAVSGAGGSMTKSQAAERGAAQRSAIRTARILSDDNRMSDDFRGWIRPGPRPPGGVEVEEGETLGYISGHYSIFQYSHGHRFSTDDVLTAWCATQWAPRVERAADLGSGIGSVALIVAWRLPGARMVTVEAQAGSVRLARKSVRYNGLDHRFTIHHGDLRQFAPQERF